MIKVWDYKKEYELLREDILGAVDGVFKSGILIFGPNVDEFEKKFSSYHDSQFGIGVGNCTDAITISLIGFIGGFKDPKTGELFINSNIDEDDPIYQRTKRKLKDSDPEQ